MRFQKTVAFCLLLVMISGCGNHYEIETPAVDGGNSTVEEEDSAGEVIDFPGYVYDKEQAQMVSRFSPMAVSEKGYYYIANQILCFYDIESGLNVPLCSRVNCDHKDAQCDAYVFTAEIGGAETACNCMGERIAYYDGRLYMIEVTDNREHILYAYDEHFNNRQKIATLAAFSAEDPQILREPETAVISEGYLFFYISWEDIKYTVDYNVPVRCCRVALEQDAEPEILGEFLFPGDYSMMRGGSNGHGILVSGGDVYFVSGATARVYAAEDPVQYVVARYHKASGEFEMLWTHTGTEILDVLGEGTGRLLSTGREVMIDDQGNLYFQTASAKATPEEMAYGIKAVNVVKFNPEDQSASVIYTTDYMGLLSFRSDGTSLYFFEFNEYLGGGESALTVIDTDGNVIASKILPIDEAYLESFYQYNERFPDNPAGLPTARSVEFYGVDDRYILLGAYALADAFKNLTSADTNTNWMSPTSENRLIIPLVGVGIISREQFLNGEGEELEIQQIFQYPLW